MTLSDQEVLDTINALLERDGIRPHERVRRLRERSAGAASVGGLSHVVDRYLAIVDPPRTCQVTHDHWEGPMICGNTLPCPVHGGR